MTQAPFYNVGTKKPGFWSRQFAPIPTRAQDKFDSIFAVVLPILCLVADPIVFKGVMPGIPEWGILRDYQLVAYLVSTIEIGLFLTWRTFRLKLRRFAPAFAGFFFAAATVSTVIGLAILPYTIIGLIVIIGVFGFIPFLTAFVFLRNGVRAMRIQLTTANLAQRCAIVLLSGFLVLALPQFISMNVDAAVSSTVEEMIKGDTTHAQLAALRLREFWFVPAKYLDEIALAYVREDNPVKRNTFNAVYRDITGDDLELRHMRMLGD